MSREAQSRGWGLVAFLVGVFVALMVLDLIPTSEPAPENAPVAVGLVCAALFMAAGVAIMLPPKSRWRLLCVGAILLGFTLVGGWIAFMAPPDGFEGGVPFVGREFNTKIARGMFGTGAVICGLMLIPLGREFVRGGKG